VKGKNEILPKNLKIKGGSVIHKDVLIFAFFLFLSFVFWYLNSLGKIIEADIKYPFRYTNIPKEKSISEETSAKLNISIKGQGFSILKLKASQNRSPLLIDISKASYKRVPGSKNLNYYITTNGLAKSFSAQLKYGFEITSIKPDTIFFTFEKTITKTGQVIPRE
jgi:hypothetical protein